MARFHIPPGSVKDGLVLLSAQESRHALTVLRIKPGEILDLFDGTGQVFKGIVAEIRDGRVLAALVETLNTSLDASVEVTLAVSVIRSEAMDLLIQKTCELGVSTVVPLLTGRTVVRISQERWAGKTARWRKIACQSCKQCGRAHVPRIDEVQPFEVFCKKLGAYDTILISTLAGHPRLLLDVLEQRPVKRVVAFVGPEGDFTSGEVARVVGQGGVPISLGALVLRSETAALYLAAVLNFYLREIKQKTCQ